MYALFADVGSEVLYDNPYKGSVDFFESIYEKK